MRSGLDGGVVFPEHSGIGPGILSSRPVDRRKMIVHNTGPLLMAGAPWS